MFCSTHCIFDIPCFIDRVYLYGSVTFEDKRRENFTKGHAELEKRRAQLREQQQKENEERLAAETAEQEKREKLR